MFSGDSEDGEDDELPCAMHHSPLTPAYIVPRIFLKFKVEVYVFRHILALTTC